MRELVEFIARSLVDEPDQVQVDEYDRDRIHVFELSVAQSDLGKVIGRQGRTARAIRNVLAAAAGRDRRRYQLEILD